MALLDDKQIQDNLAELDGWKLEGRMIVRVFEFEDFVGSINFVDTLVGPQTPWTLITTVVKVPEVMVVNPSVPANNLKE